jgi:uncharacterized damage-inducible protein DinB
MTLARQVCSVPLNATSALTTPDVVVHSSLHRRLRPRFVLVSPFYFALVVRFDSQQLERYLLSMYRNTKEFVDEWTVESNISLKVLKVITDASLDQRIYQEGRNLAHTAWHMTMMIGGIGSIVGLEVAAPKRGTEMPNSATALVEVYEKAAHSLSEQVSKTLQDSQLVVEVPYFGRSMTIERILHSLILHQCHHRGQLTVLIRQAGLVHPGVYGPTREEAAARAKQ